MHDIIFYIASFLTIVFAAMTVSCKNKTKMLVLYLLFVVFFASVVLTIGAKFIAFAIVFIHLASITMFLIYVTLMDKLDSKNTNYGKNFALGSLIAFLVNGFFFLLVWFSDKKAQLLELTLKDMKEFSASDIGTEIFLNNHVSLYLIGILVLFAVSGAVMLQFNPENLKILSRDKKTKVSYPVELVKVKPNEFN